MNSVQAFVQATPLLPSRRGVQARSRICMTEDGPKSESHSSSSNPSTPPPSKPKKTIRSSASWTKNFLTQFSQKGAGSRPDWDLRPASYRTEGEGLCVCDSCKGTGKMTCTFCMGLDHVGPNGEVKPCPACEGNKAVTCSACFGTTQQVELVGNWWDRGVAALFKK